ncbi:hypothetical protein DFJ74DRAFT_343167 [Hyaloraphidium curvatum]|nr:hypothetical protein DFJ74DRAFT_343167 [Hyaloraphidium curvatum]
MALPPCSREPSLACGNPCDCRKCSCTCTSRRKLAAKLCLVCRDFLQYASPWLWNCADLEISERRPSVWPRSDLTESERYRRFEAGLKALAKRAPDVAGGLKKLTLRVVDDWGNFAYWSMETAPFRNLSYLNVSSSTKFDAECIFEHISDSLEHLVLDGADCDFDAWVWQMGVLHKLKTLSVCGSLDTSAPFRAIATFAAASLESLLLGPWTKSDGERDYGTSVISFQDNDFRTFVNRTRDLKRLQLYSCGLITPASLATALGKFKGLTLLDLSFCPLNDDACIRLGSQSLSTLILDFTSVTDSGVAWVVERNAGLRTIKLYGTSVTDVTLDRILATCKSLTCLSLGFTNISAPGLWRLLRNGGSSALTSLTLANLPVDNDMILTLPTSFPSLYWLNLYECEGITDAEALFEMAFALRKTVRSLNFSGIPVVDAEPGFEDALASIMSDSIY